MTRLKLYLVLGAVAVALLSIAYYTGKTSGKAEVLLAVNRSQIVKLDSIIALDSARSDSARKIVTVLDSTHDVVRTKIRVVHDTVITPGHVYVDSTLARLIQVDDSTIAAQKHSLALQDTLVASLRVGLKLRDDRISLLEKQHSPRLGIKSGIAIGAVGTVALVVVAVTVIQAFHK